jgi:uncharacterized protein (DUF305 family)
MALRVPSLAFCLLWTAAAAVAQQSKPAPIVQPGAPGQRTKTVAPAAVRPQTKSPAEADVTFMQGMIHHHAQAVEMVALLRTRGASKALQSLGERMTISQSDEIDFMKKWLQDRGKPIMPGHNMANMDHNMAGMDHSKMTMSMPLMPGMLTPEQMDELAKAKGAAFDRLFLTGMIQHHTGALIMVDDLFDIPGAGQDPTIFDFATDIDNTQRAEIEVMRGMLKEIK